jgi:hypothetical protein
MAETYKWVQWKNRKHGITTAHAVDPDSKKRTGILRALNGSVIPNTAVPAEPKTPKDGLCSYIIQTRTARAKRAEARVGVKIKKKEQKEVKKQRAKVVAEDTNGLGYVEAGIDVKTGRSILRVYIENRLVKVIEDKKGQAAKSGVDLKVTDKSWGVYWSGQRIAFGRL